MTEKNIKRFRQEFLIKDTGTLASKKDQYISLVEAIMRDEGYVPVLDLNPIIVIEYVESKKQFSLVLTLQGVFTGKKKAWKIKGVSDGREWPMTNIPPDK